MALASGQHPHIGLFAMLRIYLKWFPKRKDIFLQLCHGQKSQSRFSGDGKPPTFNRNPYNGYINPYYWVDDFYGILVIYIYHRRNMSKKMT